MGSATPREVTGKISFRGVAEMWAGFPMLEANPCEVPIKRVWQEYRFIRVTYTVIYLVSVFSKCPILRCMSISYLCIYLSLLLC